MAEEYIVTYVGELPDGRHVIRHPDGHLEARKDETDWAKVDALTDEDIKAAMADDPDWAGYEEIDWSKLEVTRFVPKEPISIRLDADILEFFRKDGPGYQSRINAVLRHFMQEKLKTG